MNKTTKYIVWGAILIIFYFFFRTLISNWQRLITYKFHLNLFLFIISLLLINISVFLFAVFWGDIIYKLSKKRIPLKDLFYIQITSWFAKYIPGKVGLFLAKFYHGKKRGLNNKVITFSLIYENVFQVLSSFLIGLSFLAYFFLKNFPLNFKILSIAFLLISLIIIHPKIFYFLVNFGLKLFKRKQIEKRYFLNGKQILYYLLLYSIPILIIGIGFHLMINSIIPFNNIFVSIGTISLASVIGLLAIFAPSGLGVREGIIILILKPFMPIEVATLISLFARVWAVLADALLGLYLLILKRKI